MKNNVQHCIPLLCHSAVAAVRQCNSQRADTDALVHADTPQGVYSSCVQ